MRPDTPIYKLSKQELDRLQIHPHSNVVLVHVPHKNEDTTTKSGIIVVGDQDFKPHFHAERWGYVYKLPPSFEYDKSHDLEQWDTEIECEVGDKVWFDYRAAIYTHTYLVDGEWYKILRYTNLYVAMRGETVIPLNGYVMLKEYVRPRESNLLLEDEVDNRFAIVHKAGSKNKKYTVDMFTDDVDIGEGDHVLFEQDTVCFELENDLHQVYPEKVKLQQRKRILGVVNEDHDDILELRDGVIGVKPRKSDLTKGGIKLLKDQSKHRIADVVCSTNDKITEGSIVVIPRKKGTEFNDLEYYTEERILYYETA